MDKLVSEVLGIVLEEQRRAEEAHGALHSYNECFGVLAEEVFEMRTAAEKLNAETMLGILDAIHAGGTDRIDTLADDLMDRAVLAAAEAVQVAAVCRRIIQHTDAGK